MRIKHPMVANEQASPVRIGFLENVSRDILYAFRGFARSPGFVLVATLSLALGIGANTAIFSVMDAVLLRMLPVRQPEQLEKVALVEGKAASPTLSYPMFRGLLRDNQAFHDIFVRAAVPASLLAGDRAERGIVEVVSGSFFSALGVRPARGQFFSPEDDRVPMSRAVAVLGFNAWSQRYSADPAIVGKMIRINNYPFTIVGVAPQGFFGVEIGTTPDVWVPAMMQPAVFGAAGRQSFDEINWRCWWVFARRNANVSEAQAQATVDIAFKRLKAEYPAGNPNAAAARSLRLAPADKGLSRLRETFRSPLLVLMAAVASVLLIACANIANLLLARSTARRHEMAVRVALGAARTRLIQQSLTESLVLSALGGLLGIGVALAGIRSLLSFLPSSRMPITLQVPIDARVLGFAAATSLLAGVFFGVAPALRSTRFNVVQSLQRNETALAALQRFGLRRALVAFQVALSLLLVVAAGLFLKSLGNALATDIGLQTESVVMATVNPAQSGYTQPQLRTFYQNLQVRLQESPGVLAAGASESALLSGSFEVYPVSVPGMGVPHESPSTLVNKVGGDFFPAAGIGILRGRNFDPNIGPDTPLTAVINETAASYLFGATDPVGRKVNLAPRLPQDIEIIGVASDSKYRSVREATPRILYLSFQQETDPTRERTLYVRVQGDPSQWVGALQRSIQDQDRNLPVYNMKTFAQQKAESLLTERLIAVLSGFFGALALLLAAMGLYGVLAYVTQRRTREIGIRISLGANRVAVIWMVVRGALLMLAAGLAVGVPVCLWLSRFVQSQLFGVSAENPVILLGACAVLTGVTLLAAVVPAWKATHVNPVTALRCE